MAWAPKFTFSVTWDNVSSKPATATRWPTWDEVTDKPAIEGAVWGGITGDIAEQTDLQQALDSKVDGTDAVTLLGSQTISGTKTFWGFLRATSPYFRVIASSGPTRIAFEGPEHDESEAGFSSEGFYVGTNPSSPYAVIGSSGSTFNGPVVSTGSVSDSSGNLRTAIDQKADSSHTHLWSQVTGKPAEATRWPAVSEVTGLVDALGEKLGNTQHIPTGVNLNTLQSTGFFAQNLSADASTSLNYPVNTAGMLMVVQTGGMTYQVYIAHSTRAVYVRQRYTSTWYSWTELWNSEKFDPSSGITSPSLTGTSSILTISAGSTSGVIRFRPRGATQTTGQMELYNSGTLTSRNGYYYSYSGEIRLGSASNYIYMNSNGAVFTPGRVSAEVDNTYPCGGSGYRWTVVYATTGSINTSDAREKQDFRELTEQELQCGLQLARDAQIYRWKHAVEEKGEGARLHCSPTVQQVIATMESFGLDPFRYGFVCYDEWDAQPDEVDEEGQVTKKGSPAGDRYSLRPDELRAFVDAAIVARQDLIEARLEALEAHGSGD